MRNRSRLTRSTETDCALGIACATAYRKWLRENKLVKPSRCIARKSLPTKPPPHKMPHYRSIHKKNLISIAHDKSSVPYLMSHFHSFDIRRGKSSCLGTSQRLSTGGSCGAR